MSVDFLQGGPGGHDEGSVLVAGAKRMQLTSMQKCGVAGLVTAVFLAFIWVDHSVQAKGADKPPQISVQPNITDFKAAPIMVPPGPQPALSAPTTPAAGEMTPAGSPLFAFSLNSAGPSASDVPSIAQAAVASGSKELVPALGAARDRLGIAATGGSPDNPANALTSRMKSSDFEPTKAELLPHPDMLITKGTIIPCTLQTAINTELAGFVKCVLPEAVRSTTGNVVLLDRGTTVVGEIQSGVAQGQKRVFILWDRAETPDHAIVTLESPGSDELGRAGVSGAVNSHFWERFGGALMLSVVQGAMQAGTAAAANAVGGNGTYFNNFSSNGQQATESVLQNTMNIPPTLVKNQGDNVSIFVARDIDFSGIYSLDLKH